MTQTLTDRFWPKVDRRGPDECWEWTGSRQPTGYGRIKISDRVHNTHRVVWALTNGPIPARLQVLHRCDNPPCCNPAHLYLGTIADNMHDRDRKGRSRFGPNAPHKRRAA